MHCSFVVHIFRTKCSLVVPLLSVCMHSVCACFRRQRSCCIARKCPLLCARTAMSLCLKICEPTCASVRNTSHMTHPCASFDMLNERGFLSRVLIRFRCAALAFIVFRRRASAPTARSHAVVLKFLLRCAQSEGVGAAPSGRVRRATVVDGGLRGAHRKDAAGHHPGM